MTELEWRVGRLEAEAAIRRLKAVYFNACDMKQIDAIRGCFTKDAELDYPPIGRFGVDGLLAAFSAIALDSPIVDAHHGHNADIAIIDADHATGRWSLGFATFDPRTRTVRIMSSLYEDRYCQVDGHWLIEASRHVPRIAIDGMLADGAAVTLG